MIYSCRAEELYLSVVFKYLTAIAIDIWFTKAVEHPLRSSSPSHPISKMLGKYDGNFLDRIFWCYKKKV